MWIRVASLNGVVLDGIPVSVASRADFFDRMKLQETDWSVTSSTHQI